MGDDIYFIYLGLLPFYSDVDNRADKMKSYICQINCGIDRDMMLEPIIHPYASHLCPKSKRHSATFFNIMEGWL